MNSWDEAGYTAWPLFKESGVPAPMIWEGKKGEQSKPVMPLAWIIHDFAGRKRKGALKD
jgi:hypothetical protein